MADTNTDLTKKCAGQEINRRISLLWAGLALFLVVSWNATAWSATDNKSENLQQTADPVIITPQNLPDFKKVSISNLGLFKYSNKKFSAIPFQIDEKNKKGEWVMTSGKKAKPKEGNRLFDGSDELVFMAQDIGDRAPDGADIPEAQKGVEIDVQNHKGTIGFVYLFYFSQLAPRSPLDYVNYNPDSKIVTTDYYRLGFHPDFPISINYLATLPAAGGQGIDFVDRIKIRGTVTLLLGIKLTRNEEEFTSVDLAYIDGPVRVLRRTSNRMKIIMGIPTPSATIENVFYPAYFSLPTDMNLPFNAGLVIKNARTRTTTDLTAAAHGFTFSNSNNKQGVTIDGHMSQQEKNLDLSPFKWLILRDKQEKNGTDYAWLNRTIIDERLKDYTPTLFYNDDISQAENPEKEAGQYGNSGYSINFDEPPDVSSGVYQMTTYFFCIPGYEPGDENDYLDILDNPLQTSMRKMK